MQLTASMGHITMPSSLADQVRSDFPILATSMNGKPLVYLDNGATTQKPTAVIERIIHYYRHENANIHRGAYALSEQTTAAYERARSRVADFIGAKEASECIFVRGTTEAINLVATSWGDQHLQAGDEVVLSALEHHSNIVPWQMACQRNGAKLRVWHPNEQGELELSALGSLLNRRTKMVAFQHVSNAIGTVHDAKAIVELAKSVGARVLIDGAQWVGHFPTDVAALGCDFYAFSGHKLYGPTGIGVLWGRLELLESIPPYHGGGDMIESVAFEHTEYARLPNRLEAGTPNIAGVLGLAAAIDYVNSIGFDAIVPYEEELLEYATARLTAIDGLRILGNSPCKAAVISFVIEQPPIAPLDIAHELDQHGIAIRTGHHCCMPLMGELQVTGTSRISMAFYNTRAEVDFVAEVLTRLCSRRKTEASTRGDSEREESGLPVVFASASAVSPEEAANNLAEEFLLFDDRESKAELLMELGKQLPDQFEKLKAISSPVPGCMSEVYLIGRAKPGQDSVFEIAADSNAQIVRGLIAVLQQLFSSQSAENILGFDIEAFFRRIGLEQFVSTQRRSGLEGMIRRIQTLAKGIAST